MEISEAINIITDKTSETSETSQKYAQRIENEMHKKLGDPYIIMIKNCTDEKLKNVPVFNFEHEKQTEIEYSMCFGDCSYTGEKGYNFFLRELSSKNDENTVIKMIRIDAVCDYQKFAEKQANCGAAIFYQDSTGRSAYVPQKFEVTFGQEIKTASQIWINMPFNNLTNFILKTLMPETTVVLSLFPEKKGLFKIENLAAPKKHRISIIERPKICILGSKGMGKSSFIGYNIKPIIKDYFTIDIFNNYNNEDKLYNDSCSLRGELQKADKNKIISAIRENADKTIIFESGYNMDDSGNIDWLFDEFKKLCHPSYIIAVSKYSQVANFVKEFDWIIDLGIVDEKIPELFIENCNGKYIKEIE